MTEFLPVKASPGISIFVDTTENPIKTNDFSPHCERINPIRSFH
jgi:hypothetical protein